MNPMMGQMPMGGPMGGQMGGPMGGQPYYSMQPQQLSYLQNLFNNPQAGIDWVNNTFNQLKDQSGTIPRATFGQRIREIAISLGAPEPQPQDLEAAVQAADPNGDGMITYDEFKNFCVNAGDGLLALLGY